MLEAFSWPVEAHERVSVRARVRASESQSGVPAKLKPVPGGGLMQASIATVGREGGRGRAWEGGPALEVCSCRVRPSLQSILPAKARAERTKVRVGEQAEARAKRQHGGACALYRG